MTNQNQCPGCGRHCDLSAPHCDRGRQYAMTGTLPERGPGDGHPHRRAEDRPGGDINDHLVQTLWSLSHLMRMQYEGRASQTRILVMLREAGPLTQKALTERLGVQPGSASEILAKLEGAGLITRTPNETDRRTTDILLTDEGTRLAQEAAGQRQKRQEEMFSCLTAEEKQTLFTLLHKLRGDWERRFVKGHPDGRRPHGRHHGGAPHHGE